MTRRELGLVLQQAKPFSVPQPQAHSIPKGLLQAPLTTPWASTPQRAAALDSWHISHSPLAQALEGITLILHFQSVLP